MIEMAPKRQRDARRSATVDVYPSTERFDAAGRSRFGVRRMWSICPASFVAKGLKTERFSAPSLLVSEQMASHHFDHISRS
jgi:hypothetical protein